MNSGVNMHETFAIYIWRTTFAAASAQRLRIRLCVRGYSEYAGSWQGDGNFICRRDVL
jgi:hypothetical protein